MSSKDRDVGLDVPVEDRSREKPRRSKSERVPDRDRDRVRDREREKDRDRDRLRDKDRERERDREREHRHTRSSRSLRSKLTVDDSEAHSYASSRRHKKRSDHHGRHASTSDLTADMARSSTITSDRISMPYTGFSKAHSKEAVKSRDSLTAPRRADMLTPEPTDLGNDDDKTRRKSDEVTRRSNSKRSSRPPTPPETDITDKRRADDYSDDEGERPISRASGLSRSTSRQEDRSKLSAKTASSQATYTKSSREKARPDSRASNSPRNSIGRSSSKRDHRKLDPIDVESSPSSVQDSSPKTPTQPTPFPPNLYGGLKPASPALSSDTFDANLHSKTATPASCVAPPPPPPPPPAVDASEVPRVDYLLQNGGLPYPVPKSFLSVIPRYNGNRPSNPPLAGTDVLFAPFFNVLDQYSTVLSKHGSVAVATGHRSVARRLLDRLENVFSRDLPDHGCSCVMCDRSHEIHRGLTWGDVLEWVSGRIDLPQWPPFDLAEIGTKAAETCAEVPPRPSSPINLDPDIAEEFREHYLRQSKKVRSAVDKWLTSTAETPVPPPQDVDDETLTFAILTSLDAENRPFFNALLAGTRELRPATRAPTPGHRQRNDLLVKTGLSLQRLYRLQQVPRDAEAAMYLIKNPHTHDLLVTLSDINTSEWEILTSGRFDGFLWSGADPDDTTTTPGVESRGPTPSSYFHTRSSMNSPALRASSSMSSRNQTPFSVYSRGTTPASFVSLASSGMPTNGRHPVSNDEEMEMAAIAEIEREIYKGMESLEDAFEKLHTHAEVVRTALRQRGAALMQNLQTRRRIDVLSNPPSGNSQNSEKPAWATDGEGEGGDDDEWCFDDFELAPDDSASNISSSRHRRPKRRTERRTPAPIEEEDEQ